MTTQVIEKAKRFLDGLEVGHFETAKDWNSDDYEDFFYFLGTRTRKSGCCPSSCLRLRLVTRGEASPVC